MVGSYFLFITLSSYPIPKLKYTQDYEIYGFSNSNSSCSAYNDASFTHDANWVAAKSFSVLAVVCGVFGILLMATFGSDCVLLAACAFLFFATFSQGMTFLFFKGTGCSEILSFVDHTSTARIITSCNLAYGAGMGIAAAFLWLLCLVIAWITACCNKNERKKLRQEYIQIYAPR